MMESENRGLDLEKELTCSICTEVLYQPLTLLDCLHTFCGSCLKEWFGWQLTNSRNSPNSLPPGTTPYTCPSCRDSVRSSRHDARVTTLLEMFLAVNPTKARSAEEKEDVKKKYTSGDEILPKVEGKEKTLRERRVEDEDRRMMEEVRDLSLREAGVESSEARRERRRREDVGRLQPSSRPHSGRAHSGNGRESRSVDDRERRRRREADPDRRRARDETSLRPESGEPGNGEGGRQRRSNEESRRRHYEATSRTAARQVEHQSSLRSLMSSSDVDSQEMEEEILRQIREEGLLDGIDLENIDISQEDQITERIAEAFRRRQIEKARQEREERTSREQRRRARNSGTESGGVSGDDGVRIQGRRVHSRTPSAVSSVSALSQTDEPSRPPPAMSQAHAAHLDIQSADEGRRRRRTTSGSRSSTAPTPTSEVIARPAARSHTDLSHRPQSMDLSSPRHSLTSSSRSTTDPSAQRPVDFPNSERASRDLHRAPSSSPRIHINALMDDLPSSSSTDPRRAPPTDIFIPSTLSPTVDHSLIPAPLSPSQASRSSLSDRSIALSSGARPSSSSSQSIGSRARAPLYPEPSITCSRCQKPHIEYDLHYNCGICFGGNYNICLSCFRDGLGCLHWFGFGHAAFDTWEARIHAGSLPPTAEKPHMLIASRYIPPRRTPGGAEGRKTLTTEDPQKRLQSGVFCAGCLAWANECYWRCDSCNGGDWGFCNLCVNQGKCCTHPLLPLTFKALESEAPPLSPTHDHKMPSSATILSGPGVIDTFGRFKPLTFSTRCDICNYPIHPSTRRYHCFSCASKVPNTQRGDYDICTTCYPKLLTSRRISAENGDKGWRRCLQGHRMIVIGFEDNHHSQCRVVVNDLVGGWTLKEEPYTSTSHSDLQNFSWQNAQNIRLQHVKLATESVMNTPPNPSAIPNLRADLVKAALKTALPGSDIKIEEQFPPEGGVGMTCLARWAWYPKDGADDELMFPKGAELREVKDVGDDWWYGTYMGKSGMFPAPYVRVLGQGRD